MRSDLSLSDNYSAIVSYMPEHREMMENISINHPEIVRATSFFGKTQSQFMDNLLTVSHLTPIRNIRQILAEMEKIRNSLKESYFSCKKREIEILKKKRLLEETTDSLEKELINIEIMEIESSIDVTRLYISGSIRKLNAYTEQYNSIMKEKGISEFNEKVFEEEEEKYHIMKSFEQALSAARSRSGTIDEGNLIYLSQIGINGTVAQRCISEYLALENKLLSEGKEPTYKMQLNFLESMVDKFHGSSEFILSYKGMQKNSNASLLLQGDTRLLK